jgi:hypothetical protein
MDARRYLELSNHKINTKWNSKQLSYVIPNIILGGYTLHVNKISVGKIFKKECQSFEWKGHK